MDCDSYQTELPDLIYGELDPEARPLVEDHRRGCTSCDALTRELEQVKGSLPQLRPPPLLAARLKLAARDELLARGSGPSDGPPPPPLGAVLRLVSVVVLAACVGVVGFALGVSSRPRSDGDGTRLAVPRTATDVPAPPGWVDPEPPRGPPRSPPRSPEAWQRVLFDAAVGHREQGDARQAAEFFQRSIAVAPEGPMAAPAMVGRAEALLQLGERAEAATLLEDARRGILGGRLVGGPTLLQRIAELTP